MGALTLLQYYSIDLLADTETGRDPLTGASSEVVRSVRVDGTGRGMKWQNIDPSPRDFHSTVARRMR